MFKFIKNLFRLSPNQSSRPDIDERILNCPWPDDITIDRSSFIGNGSYTTVAGREYHSVTCSADGPNKDSTTFHHTQLGYWGGFKSFQEANRFTIHLWGVIKSLLGTNTPVYVSGQDKNDHARWCMGEITERPIGLVPFGLPTDFESYNR